MAEIADAAFKYQQQVEKGTKKVVGVNVHTATAEPDLEILRISKQVEAAQSERLAQFRSARDGSRSQAALERLQAAARTDENLIPVIMDAVRAESTLGEICAALKNVYGTYREPPVI